MHRPEDWRFFTTKKEALAEYNRLYPDIMKWLLKQAGDPVKVVRVELDFDV